MLLLFSEAIFSAVFIIPLLIFFESKPKTPPSAIAAKGANLNISFTDSICKMLKDKIFVFFKFIFKAFNFYIFYTILWNI